MNKLDRVVAHYSFKAKLAAKEAAKKFLIDERGDVNVVSIVVLIAVAVVLALAFKDRIAKLLKTLFGNIDKTTKEATSSVTF